MHNAMSSDHPGNDDPRAGFVWPLRVYYEDTDAGGVVFYANYLKFMERARTEWLSALGFEQDELREHEGVLFVVRRVTLDYRASARFNERLLVRTSLPVVGGASMEFAQSIEREQDATCCCEGRVSIACIDAGSSRPRRMPRALLAALKEAVR